MKLVHFQAENIKKIRALDLNPDQTWNVIGGKNDQGKTTLIQCVKMLLAGKGAIPKEAITQGEKSGFVIGELENGLIVTLKITENKSYLEVSTKEGAKYGSPQSMLNDMFGPYAFDPTEFERMDSKKQAQVLAKMAGIDLEDFAERRGAKYTERTETGRRKKVLEGKLQGVDLKNLPRNTVDVSEIQAELREAQQHNESIRQAAEGRRILEAQVATLDRDIADLRETLRKKNAQKIEAQERLDKLGEPEATVDTDELQERLHQANQTNLQVAQSQGLLAYKKELDELDETYTACTEAIASIDEELATAISKAKLPIEGVSFDQEGVRVNGVPFEEEASSKRFMISCAIAIGPKPGILLLEHGVLLDEERRQILRDMCEEKGAQAFLEVVSEGPECTIIMENGTAKEVKE